LSNRPIDAAQAAAAIRKHRGIENGSHHVRAVTLRENASRLRENPGSFAKIRRFAYNILRFNQRDSVAQDRYAAALGGLNTLLSMNFCNEIPWGVDSSQFCEQTGVVYPLNPRRRPMSLDHHREELTAIRTNLGAIFVSLELSRSIWLITSLSPGSGEKMSKHRVSAGDIAALLTRFSELKQKAFARTGKSFPIIVIQEAGLDGFWIHRVLQSEGIESYVVDPASIATSRRRRRAKTDRIDGEALVRALLAYKRGEPRVCAMARAPTPEDEDTRRLCRERKTLTVERIQHVNRIKGLLFSQGVSDYEPLRRNRRQRLDELKTGDGRPLPPHLKAQISRELHRVELLIEQIKAVETERDALLEPAAKTKGTLAPQAMLHAIKGIGPEFAAVLWSEGLYRSFSNRKQVAAYAGLAPTPWQSGSVDREQGVSKAGNPRLRTTLIQIAWLWLRHQPQSALALWFKERVSRNGGRLKKPTIVALARKLLVALWKYVTAGVVIEGAVMKSA
jgi:transposase